MTIVGGSLLKHDPTEPVDAPDLKGNGEIIPMPASATDKIAEALAKAQLAMDNAVMNNVNPHFKSKYADLAAVRDATIPHLSAEGLAIVQFTSVRGDSLLLITRLMHVSGQSIEAEYPLPFALDKPQIMGSAMTYARRYCWSAMCGIASESDDDGNAASDNKAASKRPQSTGPLTVTKLKEGLRGISGDLDACEDAATLAGIREKAKPIMVQAKRDLPDWHDAAEARFENLEAEYSDNAEREAIAGSGE